MPLCYLPSSSSAVARAFPLYSCSTRKRSAGEQPTPSPSPRNVAVYLRVPSALWPDVRKDISATAEGIRLAARLVDTPPNFLHTSAFVKEAMAVAEALKHHDVVTKIIRGKDLADQGFGGLYGVGMAAIEPPALVVLSHPGKKSGTMQTSSSTAKVPSAERSVCFVGKGIVYDSGGLSIKSKTGMVSGFSTAAR